MSDEINKFRESKQEISENACHICYDKPGDLKQCCWKFLICDE